MRQWFGILLALALSLAVVMPARLHAMAQDHTAHAAAASHGDDCTGGYGDRDGDGPPASCRQHALCMAACACLPVDFAPPGGFTRVRGERLPLSVQAALPSREPEIPRKPPRAA